MSPRLIELRTAVLAAVRGRPLVHVALWPAPQDPPASLLHDGAHGPTLQRWRDWCTAHPGHEVQLALSCRWSLHWVVAPAGQAGAEQAWISACEEAAHYLGDAFVPDDWAWRSWPLPDRRDTADNGPAWLVVALPRALLTDLRAIADATDVRVSRVGPWWADWLDAEQDTVQLNDAGWQLSWHRSAAHLQCIPRHSDTMGSEVSSVEVEGPHGAAGLCEGPFNWRPTRVGGIGRWRRGLTMALGAVEALDFSRHARPMAVWAWALPLLGALALLSGLWQWQRQEVRAEALMQQQQRLAQAEHRLRVQRAAAMPRLRASQRPAESASTLTMPWSPAQQLAAEGVLARLSWPWLQGLALSTEGASPAHIRWAHWQFDLGDQDGAVVAQPQITLTGWVTHDEALGLWLSRTPQARWVSRERLRDPVPGAQGELTLKGQWQMPWPEAAP